ncbi:hypothetical protein Bca4012_061668 [Brassica carinata]
MKKRINGRYSVDDSRDGDDDGSGETGHGRKSSRRHGRRGSDSETQERLEDKEDTRTHWSSSDRRARKEEHREGSSGDQEESHAHDRVVHADKSHRERWKHGHERSSSRFSHEGDSSERIPTEAGKENDAVEAWGMV